MNAGASRRFLVKRQWCSHRGKVDNCQVGVFWGYVSAKGKALVELGGPGRAPADRAKGVLAGSVVTADRAPEPVTLCLTLGLVNVAGPAA